MADMERKRASTEPKSIGNTQNVVSDSSMQSSSVEKIAPSHNGMAMSPPPPLSAGLSRSSTFAARHGNRLSLSFPIQTTDISSHSRRTPISTEPSSASSQPPGDSLPQQSPADSGGFLVALAAQERRVLELKEELVRAEEDLGRLKKQWAVHEAKKKRAEIRHNVEQLRPVSNIQDSAPDDEPEDAAVRRSVEMGRRKAMLINANKDSRRKVITGGHTRTLSLLSPDRKSPALHPSPNLDGVMSRNEEGRSISRSATVPDTSQNITKINSNMTRHTYQDSAAHGVKQIAEDLRAGLWTFMEDLRQATVGDEALKSPPPRSNTEASAKSVARRASKQNLAPNRGQSSSRAKSSSRTRESAVRANSAISDRAPPMTPNSEKKLDIPSLDDDWSNWDSPVSKKGSPRWSSSTIASSENTESSPTKTTENSMEPTGEIPWPALIPFSPSNLKQTASVLMKEWEKTLSPLAQDHQDPISANSSSSKSAREQEASLLLSNLP